MDDLTKTINAVSREVLDQIPGARGLIIVLSDHVSDENLRAVRDKVLFSGSGRPSLHKNSLTGQVSKALISFECDGYEFHFYRESDLKGEIIEDSI